MFSRYFSLPFFLLSALNYRVYMVSASPVGHLKLHCHLAATLTRVAGKEIIRERRVGFRDKVEDLADDLGLSSFIQDRSIKDDLFSGTGDDQKLF